MVSIKILGFQRFVRAKRNLEVIAFAQLVTRAVYRLWVCNIYNFSPLYIIFWMLIKNLKKCVLCNKNLKL